MTEPRHTPAPEGPSPTSSQQRVSELEQELALLKTDQRAIRDREARFRILSELVTDCCWARWRSADGTVERAWVNEAFTRLTGYTPEEFEQVGREGLVHPDDLEKIRDFIDGPLGVSEHEFRIIRKDGQVRWLHERLQVKEEDGGISVFGATRDVTAQKEAEEVLRASHRQLEQRVAERTAELRQLNQQLQDEVLERRQVEAELRRSKAAAEASNRAKSLFLATMTHELRTPLHGIINLIELLQRVDLPEQTEGWIGALQTSAEGLSKLVEEVLDFSKIEAEQLALEKRPFSFENLANDLRQVLIHRAEQRGNRLDISLDSNLPPQVEGDGARLRQILLNLLDNALKFTENGRVELVLTAQKAAPGDEGCEPAVQVRFEVRDSGVGFDEEARRRIFDPFTQADASTTRRFGGTGLGLTISQRLIELMGGQLEARSIPEEGSEFFFTLPFSRPASEPETPVEPSLLPHDLRILVAEDNPVNQIVIHEQLESLGLQVVTVSDGQQALAELEGTVFDALLLDCHMPEVDGFETARRIRAAESSDRRLPIIAITASAIRQELEACREAGMDDVLSKPYRRRELVEMLAKWLPSFD